MSAQNSQITTLECNTPRDYARLPVTFEGQPVLYNAKTNDLAYEERQEGRLITLPPTAETTIRHQCGLPRSSCRNLTQPGRFVALTPSAIAWTARRGEVLFSDAIGLTLRVTAHTSDTHDHTLLARPITELWPWGEITVVTAADPTARERKLLNASPA